LDEGKTLGELLPNPDDDKLIVETQETAHNVVPESIIEMLT
jgi:hypothetical protein